MKITVPKLIVAFLIGILIGLSLGFPFGRFSAKENKENMIDLVLEAKEQLDDFCITEGFTYGGYLYRDGDRVLLRCLNQDTNSYDDFLVDEIWRR